MGVEFGVVQFAAASRIGSGASRVYLQIRDSPFREAPFGKAEVTPRDQVIPPVCYQTFESNNFGRRHREAIKAFHRLNPAVDFQFFSDEQQEAWMIEHFSSTQTLDIFRRLRHGPARADIFRYCIVLTQGGYYFDISKGCDIPLFELHEKDSVGMISFEQNSFHVPPTGTVRDRLLKPFNYVLQWGLGFRAGHPILTRVLSNIVSDLPRFEDQVFESPKAAILRFTGPGQFTRAVHECAGEGLLSGVCQAGVDFWGHGLFALPGSSARYLSVPGYAAVRNERILD